MKHKLTVKISHSKREKDGKRRNFILYFLNDVLILKQKYPYDNSYDKGFENRINIYDEYLLNGVLYQKREYVPSIAFWKTDNYKEGKKIRNVKYPVSKSVLAKFDIPKDTLILCEHSNL